MQTLSLHPEDIQVGERRRALSAPDVERLSASMSEIGLRQPITVRVVDEMEIDGQMVSGVPILVAGAHRLAAAKKLGWQTIDCIEVDDDDIGAELWEIAENLHRLDLTKEQRDEHLRRYAELLEVKRGLSAKVSNNSPAPVGRPKAIATEVAEGTGLSARTVRRVLNPPAPKPAMPAEDVVTVQFNALMAAWNRAGAEARELFMEEIDGPVFDRTRSAA